MRFCNPFKCRRPKSLLTRHYLGDHFPLYTNKRSNVFLGNAQLPVIASCVLSQPLNKNSAKAGSAEALTGLAVTANC